MSKHRFTFVLDYRGGTYVTQNVASSLQDAVANLPASLDWEGMNLQPTPAEMRAFLADLAAQSPVAVQGMSNVWCISPSLADTVATIHVVATAEQALHEAMAYLETHAPSRKPT